MEEKVKFNVEDIGMQATELLSGTGDLLGGNLQTQVIEFCFLSLFLPYCVEDIGM